MAFTIITLDGSQSSTAGQPPVGQSVIVVAGNDPNLQPQPVNRDNPFPAGLYYGNSGKQPVEMLMAAVVQTAAFEPIPGRPFNIDLLASNDFAGRVQLVRSFDDGDTWNVVTDGGQPLDWGGSVSERAVETEVGVQYALNMTERTAGSVAARISQ